MVLASARAGNSTSSSAGRADLLPAVPRAATQGKSHKPLPACSRVEQLFEQLPCASSVIQPSQAGGAGPVVRCPSIGRSQFVPDMLVSGRRSRSASVSDRRLRFSRRFTVASETPSTSAASVCGNP